MKKENDRAVTALSLLHFLSRMRNSVRMSGIVLTCVLNVQDDRAGSVETGSVCCLLRSLCSHGVNGVGDELEQQ